MQYFSKVTGSALSLAKQSMQAISIIASDDNNAVEPARESPHQVLESNFRAACELMETLACMPDSKTVEGDRRLQQSKVKNFLREVVAILEEESNKWNKRGVSPLDGDGSPGTPCMDTFLQSRMVQELCNRAVLDSPRGCLPLILTTLSLLLRSVSYPLLPHMTVHKPIANLISVAVRYDAMHMYTNAANAAVEGQAADNDADAFNRQEYSNYKRRIEIGLIGLLRVLWRKFSENPAILDYFTFEDRRKRADSLSYSPVGRLNSSTGTPNSALTIQTQMDVLNALVNMLHKPRVSLYAQEALLVALNMCDRRIDRFLRVYTKLIELVVAELCKRFQLALDAANDALSAPISSYCGSLGSASSNLNSSNSGGSSSTVNANRSPAPATNSTGALSSNTSTVTAAASSGNSTRGSITSTPVPPNTTASNSLLSPLSKISSFTLGGSIGSAAKANPSRSNAPPLPPASASTKAAGTPSQAQMPAFNSPSATAAAAYAFAKGALYGPASATGAGANGGAKASAQGSGQDPFAPASEPRSSPMQNLLRTLRFCVALAAAMRRMALQNTTPSSSTSASVESAETATYDLLVECFVENFLQDVLKNALQSRGEGNAVAINLVLRGVLEEMFTAEQLWATHSSSSSGAASSALAVSSNSKSRATKSLLYYTTQFLCGSLLSDASLLPASSVPVINKSLFGTPPPASAMSSSPSPGSAVSFYTGTGSAAGQVNYTAVMLARVGSITRLISVSSYLALCSVLQSAPLSLALQVALNLPTGPSDSGSLSKSASTSAPPSPLTGAPSTLAADASTYRSLDDALTSICSAQSVVANNTLAEDLASASASTPSASTATASSTPNTPARRASTGVPAAKAGTLDMQKYTEIAAQNILARLPGKALWSLLSADPELSALSPALLKSLQENALCENKGGVIEVLHRRLGSFLSMKFDEQVALTALLQRTVCLLSVLVLACPLPESRVAGVPDTAVFYLLQITDFLKQVDKLWKEIKGYLPRIPSAAAKVPAMRQVLQAAAQTEIENSIYFSIANEAGQNDSTGSNQSSPQVGIAGQVEGTGRVSLVQRVDAGSYKLVEKETAQARSILEGAVLLHEMRAELRSYVLAIKSLRAQVKDTSSGSNARLSGRYGRALTADGLEGGPLEDLGEEPAPEDEEDDHCALVMRQAMHSFGWAVPDFHGAPYDPRTMAPAPTSSYLALALAAGVNSTPLRSANRSLASTRDTTPNASTANLSALPALTLSSNRRGLLIANLNQRQEEFLAEYQALEKALEDIVGTDSDSGA